MIYQFAKGCRLSGNPQVVGECLATIHENQGRLTAPDVVDTARSEESLLHPYFEWDDSAAANEYRLTQARHLIRSVVVVQSLPSPKCSDPVTVRAFIQVNIPQSAEETGGDCDGDADHSDGKDVEILTLSSYEPLSVVVATPSLRRQAVEDILDDIDSLRRKLASIEQFAMLMPTLDEIREIVAEQLTLSMAA